MIDSLISAFSNAKLVSFLRSQNASFVDYEEDLSDIISDFEKYRYIYLYIQEIGIFADKI
jgi:2-hydroxy-3-keto-5-methylthiopentenyl-1-phosphate phosphatase